MGWRRIQFLLVLSEYNLSISILLYLLLPNFWSSQHYEAIIINTINATIINTMNDVTINMNAMIINMNDMTIMNTVDADNIDFMNAPSMNTISDALLWLSTRITKIYKISQTQLYHENWLIYPF